MTSSHEVQKAVFDALTAAAISDVTTIRDTPILEPSPADYPFIQIGSSQTIPLDTNGSDGTGDDGVEEFFDIHSWSRTTGQKQIKEIMSAIYAALHHQNLTVTGRPSVLCVFDGGRVIDDPDGQTRHSIQTFKITHRS